MITSHRTSTRSTGDAGFFVSGKASQEKYEGVYIRYMTEHFDEAAAARSGKDASVVEEADAGKRHRHTESVASLDDLFVPDGTARLGDITDAAGVSPADIILKRKERVGTQGYFRQARQPVLPDIRGKRLRFFREVLLPAIPVK